MKNISRIFVVACAVVAAGMAGIGAWLAGGNNSAANSLDEISYTTLPACQVVYDSNTPTGENWNTFTLQKGCIYFFEVWGAQGGGGGAVTYGSTSGGITGKPGGFGSYAYGWYDTRSYPSGISISISIGTAGGSAPGGHVGSSLSKSGAAGGVGAFNGAAGGNGFGSYAAGGGGGGGASAIYFNTTPIIIAGGGGGSSGGLIWNATNVYNYPGAAGGGATGSNGVTFMGTEGAGGKQQTSGPATAGVTATRPTSDMRFDSPLSGGGGGGGGYTGGTGGGAGGGASANYSTGGGGAGGSNYIEGVGSLSDYSRGFAWAATAATGNGRTAEGDGSIRITQYQGQLFDTVWDAAVPNGGVGYKVSQPSQSWITPVSSYTFTITSKVAPSAALIKYGTVKLTNTSGNVYTFTVNNVIGQISKSDFRLTFANSVQGVTLESLTDESAVFNQNTPGSYSVNLQPGRIYFFETWGAQGGGGANNPNGGLGSYAQGWYDTRSNTSTVVATVYVGGRGDNGSGATGGVGGIGQYAGAKGGNGSSQRYGTSCGAGGGGGASSLLIGTTPIIVAGGGGGNGATFTIGGGAGGGAQGGSGGTGLISASGPSASVSRGSGGAQTNNSTATVGGNGSTPQYSSTGAALSATGGGGGGGGYPLAGAGGGGGTAQSSSKNAGGGYATGGGGGGGGSYIGSLKSITGRFAYTAWSGEEDHISQTGNGKVKITAYNEPLPDTFDVESPSSETGFSVSEPSETQVEQNGSYQFTITTDEGYTNCIPKVSLAKNGTVGQPVKDGNDYTFTVFDVSGPIEAADFTVTVTMNTYRVMIPQNGTGYSIICESEDPIMVSHNESYKFKLVLEDSHSNAAYQIILHSEKGFLSISDPYEREYTVTNVRGEIVTSDFEVIVPINIYTVKFNSMGGSSIGNQTIDYGSTVKKPADPTLDGYLFDGWYTIDDMPWDVATVIEGDLTLYAKWKEKTNEDIRDEIKDSVRDVEELVDDIEKQIDNMPDGEQKDKLKDDLDKLKDELEKLKDLLDDPEAGIQDLIDALDSLRDTLSKIQIPSPGDGTDVGTEDDPNDSNMIWFIMIGVFFPLFLLILFIILVHIRKKKIEAAEAQLNPSPQ